MHLLQKIELCMPVSVALNSIHIIHSMKSYQWNTLQVNKSNETKQSEIIEKNCSRTLFFRSQLMVNVGKTCTNEEKTKPFFSFTRLPSHFHCYNFLYYHINIISTKPYFLDNNLLDNCKEMVIFHEKSTSKTRTNSNISRFFISVFCFAHLVWQAI